MSKKVKKPYVKPYHKVITLMLSGRPITIEEFNERLGSEILMYKISMFIWEIKNYAGGIIRVAKDGKKVVSYQLMNTDEVAQFMRRCGIEYNLPTIEKLSDLNATPIDNDVENDVQCHDMTIEEIK